MEKTIFAVAITGLSFFAFAVAKEVKKEFHIKDIRYEIINNLKGK